MKADFDFMYGLVEFIEKNHTDTSKSFRIPVSHKTEYHLRLCQEAGYLILERWDEHLPVGHLVYRKNPYESRKEEINGTSYMFVKRLTLKGHEKLHDLRRIGTEIKHVSFDSLDE